MPRLVLVIVLLLVHIVEAPAQASLYALTAGELEQRCKAMAIDGRASNASAGFCSGYFEGAWHGLQIAQALAGKTVFCIPEKPVQTADVIRVFLKRMEEQPESRKESASLVTGKVMMDLFLCRGGGH